MYNKSIVGKQSYIDGGSSGDREINIYSKRLTGANIFNKEAGSTIPILSLTNYGWNTLQIDDQYGVLESFGTTLEDKGIIKSGNQLALDDIDTLSYPSDDTSDSSYSYLCYQYYGYKKLETNDEFSVGNLGSYIDIEIPKYGDNLSIYIPKIPIPIFP